jgi:hypothetical protein
LTTYWYGRSRAQTGSLRPHAQQFADVESALEMRQHGVEQLTFPSPERLSIDWT